MVVFVLTVLVVLVGGVVGSEPGVVFIVDSHHYCSLDGQDKHQPDYFLHL